MFLFFSSSILPTFSSHPYIPMSVISSIPFHFPFSFSLCAIAPFMRAYIRPSFATGITLASPNASRGCISLLSILSDIFPSLTCRYSSHKSLLPFLFIGCLLFSFCSFIVCLFVCFFGLLVFLFLVFSFFHPVSICSFVTCYSLQPFCSCLFACRLSFFL